MITLLKRTTAIAALAALPLAPVAASAQSQQGEAQTRPEAQDGLSSEQSSTAGQVGAEVSGEEPASDRAETTGSDAGETAAGTAEDEDTQGQQQAVGDQQPAGDTTEAEDTAQTKGAMQAEEATDEDASQAGSTTQAGDPAKADDTQTGEARPGADTGTETAEQDEADQEGDLIVARVGDADIMRSDVLGVIGALPPEIQQQPAEVLIPMAVEQLVLRELILDEARAAGLDDDPDVDLLVGDASDASGEMRENAMVQVWLDRELEGAVTDEAVQETYGTVQNQFGDQVPPLEQIRPQIEEEVRRQAFLVLSDELHSNADVTLFGPNGEPIE